MKQLTRAFRMISIIGLMLVVSGCSTDSGSTSTGACYGTVDGVVQCEDVSASTCASYDAQEHLGTTWSFNDGQSCFGLGFGGS